MPELGYKPTNKYLPPRSKSPSIHSCATMAKTEPKKEQAAENPFLRWVDRALSR